MECNLTTKYLKFIIQSYGLKLPPCKMYVIDKSYSDNFYLYVVINMRDVSFLKDSKLTKEYITSYKSKSNEIVIVFDPKEYINNIEKLLENKISELFTNEQLKVLRITERSYPNIYGVIKRTDIGKEYFKNHLIDKFNYNGTWSFLEEQEWEHPTNRERESFTS